MADDRKLKPIGSVFCDQYTCEARFYTDEAHPSGQRHLVVQYGAGYSGPVDLPIVDGRRRFASAIPGDWSEQELHGLLLEPMNPEAPHPAWEVPARAHGSARLFRWWADEKPE
jgi:hypothetical protein